MDSVKVMSRESLHELVWSRPISEISKEFGLSDKGLTKKCKKHKIPTPHLGYWAKIQAGKKAVKTKLPKSSDPFLDKVIFYPKTETSSAHRESKVVLSENELERAVSYIFPKRVNNYHDILKGVKKVAKKDVDKYGRVHWFSIKTTPSQLNRACLFLEGLIRLFKTYGWEAKSKEASNQSHGSFYFTNGSEEIFFEIAEAVKQVDHIENENDSRFWSPKYDYLPTNVLELRLTNMYRTGFKTIWKDSSKHSIEERVLSIAESFSRAFDFKMIDATQKEKESLKWERERRIRYEQDRLEKIELARIEHLKAIASDFECAKSIHLMIKAFRDSGTENLKLESWLKWAEQVADSIDPTKNADEILVTDEKLSEKAFHH